MAHVMPCWAQGMQMRDGKSSELLWAPPKKLPPTRNHSACPPPHGALHHTLPQQSELALIHNHYKWWFLCCLVVLQQWHSILAEHQPWRQAQDCLVLSATMEQSLAYLPRTDTCSLCHWRGTFSPTPLLGMPLPGTQSNFPALSDGSALSIRNSSIFHANTVTTQELGPVPCWGLQEDWARATTSTMWP